MAEPTALAKRVFITACALTRTTELASALTGAGFFLPSLFVLRYANMGGLDAQLFARQLSQARSFSDERWCRHWDSIAEHHLGLAEQAVRELTGDRAVSLRSLCQPGEETAEVRLHDVLGPVAPLIADHGGPQPSTEAIKQIVGEHAPPDQYQSLLQAFTAVDAWIKAITYFQVSAFPGHTPKRTRAYWASRRLAHALITSLAPGLGVMVESVDIPVADDVVRGYLVIPDSPQGRHPVVLVTNGLEGTVQELLLPLLKYRSTGMATFVMEMPGSYVYRVPMAPRAEGIYRKVIDYLATHPRCDGDRIGMVGVSFGGYWAARMAAADPRVRCAVACGAPAHHTFRPTSSLGKPQIIIRTMRDVTHATGVRDLSRKLRAMSLREKYAQMLVPLLVINGDNDTLISTEDSRELAHRAPNATLKLYAHDDHCAMRHYREWLDLSQQWLHDRLEEVAGQQTR